MEPFYQWEFVEAKICDSGRYYVVVWRDRDTGRFIVRKTGVEVDDTGIHFKIPRDHNLPDHERKCLYENYEDADRRWQELCDR